MDRGHDMTVLEASGCSGGDVETIHDPLPDGHCADVGAEHFYHSPGQVIGRSNKDALAPQSEPIAIRHFLGAILRTLFDADRLRLVADLPREFTQIMTG
jgi:hypothetical protein